MKSYFFYNSYSFQCIYICLILFHCYRWEEDHEKRNSKSIECIVMRSVCYRRYDSRTEPLTRYILAILQQLSTESMVIVVDFNFKIINSVWVHFQLWNGVISRGCALNLIAWIYGNVTKRRSKFSIHSKIWHWENIDENRLGQNENSYIESRRICVLCP